MGTERQKTETIEAVYEHGGFRPLFPVDMNLKEGQKVAPRIGTD